MGPAGERCDVLVVGAGPTGLALAAQLLALGVRARVVDRSHDRVHESRALALQPRTLEVLRPLGVTEELVARGRTATRLRVHVGGRTLEAPVFDTGLDDTAHPYLLLLSQAHTEEVLAGHLAGRGLRVERGTAVERLEQTPDEVAVTLRRPDGSADRVRARWVVGCDGAHSTVREAAGIGSTGGRYPQTFLLADLAADGVPADVVDAWLTPAGPLLLFPLGDPAPHRMVTVRLAARHGAMGPPTGPPQRAELQTVADEATGGVVRLGEPVWSSAFTIAHRTARQYRSGRLLLAGDAAHVHSPAGAQGMNTGVQDAVNLGWKLALVCRGLAREELVDTYDAERRPVGEAVVRTTDRVFTLAVAPGPVAAAVRARVVPLLAAVVLRSRALRARGIRAVSELDVHYRRSPAVERSRGRLTRRLRPGDRLPDAPLPDVPLPDAPLPDGVLPDGARGRGWRHDVLAAPGFHLLLAGGAPAGDAEAARRLAQRCDGLLAVHRVGRAPGVRRAGHVLVRPDGHVALLSDRPGLDGVTAHLERWLVLPPWEPGDEPGAGPATGATRGPGWQGAAVQPAISESRAVGAPAALVHDLLVDVSSWPLWAPHVLRTEPSTGRVHAGWRGRVRPWFGPATTMEVTEVLPAGGMRWRTRALGHELSYAQLVSPRGEGSAVTFTAEVTGPAGGLVQRLAAPLSAFGQRRRLERLALLAERLAR